MQTVVCDNAAKAVAGYVSYMKRFGFNQSQLINSKNSMLTYLRGFISKAVAAKRDNKPEWRTCYWRDGYTPMTWCFTLYLLPQQKLVTIMAFTYKENKPGVKENRRVVRLTESKIRKIVEESMRVILKEIHDDNDSELCESYSIRRLGCYDVVKGDNQPHSIKGLEQYGNALYDVRLYSNVSDRKETFAIFSIGKNTSKYICCRLESDEEYGTWLGFTPIKNYDVPTMIKQDLKNTPINQ